MMTIYTRSILFTASMSKIEPAILTKVYVLMWINLLRLRDTDTRWACLAFSLHRKKR